MKPLKCHWRLNGNWTGQVYVTFAKVRLPGHKNCTNATMQVVFGTFTENGSLVEHGRLCGCQPDNTRWEPGHRWVWVEFVSSGYTNPNPAAMSKYKGLLVEYAYDLTPFEQKIQLAVDVLVGTIIGLSAVLAVAAEYRRHRDRDKRKKDHEIEKADLLRKYRKEYGNWKPPSKKTSKSGDSLRRKLLKRSLKRSMSVSPVSTPSQSPSKKVRKDVHDSVITSTASASSKVVDEEADSPSGGFSRAGQVARRSFKGLQRALQACGAQTSSLWWLGISSSGKAGSSQEDLLPSSQACHDAIIETQEKVQQLASDVSNDREGTCDKAIEEDLASEESNDANVEKNEAGIEATTSNSEHFPHNEPVQNIRSDENDDADGGKRSKPSLTEVTDESEGLPNIFPMWNPEVHIHEYHNDSEADIENNQYMCSDTDISNIFHPTLTEGVHEITPSSESVLRMLPSTGSGDSWGLLSEIVKTESEEEDPAHESHRSVNNNQPYHMSTEQDNMHRSQIPLDNSLREETQETGTIIKPTEERCIDGEGLFGVQKQKYVMGRRDMRSLLSSSTPNATSTAVASPHSKHYQDAIGNVGGTPIVIQAKKSVLNIVQKLKESIIGHHGRKIKKFVPSPPQGHKGQLQQTILNPEEYIFNVQTQDSTPGMSQNRDDLTIEDLDREQFYYDDADIGYIGCRRSIDSLDYKSMDTADADVTFNVEKCQNTSDENEGNDNSEEEWQAISIAATRKTSSPSRSTSSSSFAITAPRTLPSIQEVTEPSQSGSESGNEAMAMTIGERSRYEKAPGRSVLSSTDIFNFVHPSLLSSDDDYTELSFRSSSNNTYLVSEHHLRTPQERYTNQRLLETPQPELALQQLDFEGHVGADTVDVKRKVGSSIGEKSFLQSHSQGSSYSADESSLSSPFTMVSDVQDLVHSMNTRRQSDQLQTSYDDILSEEEREFHNTESPLYGMGTTCRNLQVESNLSANLLPSEKRVSEQSSDGLSAFLSTDEENVFDSTKTPSAASSTPSPYSVVFQNQLFALQHHKESNLTDSRNSTLVHPDSIHPLMPDSPSTSEPLEKACYHRSSQSSSDKSASFPLLEMHTKSNVYMREEAQNCSPTAQYYNDHPGYQYTPSTTTDKPQHEAMADLGSYEELLASSNIGHFKFSPGQSSIGYQYTPSTATDNPQHEAMADLSSYEELLASSNMDHFKFSPGQGSILEFSDTEATFDQCGD